MQVLGRIMVKVADIKKFYTYSVHNSQGRCMYVGHGNFGTATSISKLHGNPLLDKEEIYEVRLHNVHNREIDALNEIGKISRFYCPTISPPWQHMLHMNRYITVKCDQTGEIYRNASVACQTLGIQASRMSNHLSRKPGNKTIRGMTFSYVNPFDMDKMLAKVGCNPDGTKKDE